MVWVVLFFMEINLKEPVTGLHFCSFCGACLGLLKVSLTRGVMFVKPALKNC